MRSGNVTKEGEGEVTYMLCVTGRCQHTDQGIMIADHFSMSTKGYIELGLGKSTVRGVGVLCVRELNIV